jgi:hypothetical protein
MWISGIHRATHVLVFARTHGKSFALDWKFCRKIAWTMRSISRAIITPLLLLRATQRSSPEFLDLSHYLLLTQETGKAGDAKGITGTPTKSYSMFEDVLGQ